MATITMHTALRRLHSFLDRTQQVTGALAGFRDLNMVSGLGLAAQIARLATEMVSKDVAELSKGWKHVPLPFEAMALVENFCSPFKEASGESWSHYKVAGQGVLYDHPPNHKHPDQFLVEHDPETFLYHVRESLWRSHGDQILLEPVARSPWDVDFQLRPYTSVPSQPSQRAEEVWGRVEPFLRGGMTRSLLMDGRPGTGKTTIAQVLIDKARCVLPNSRVLRIPAGDFGFLSSGMLQGLLGLMQPSILVVDDFDRIAGVDSLLDFLEGCRRWVQFLVVTTNHLEKLSQAVVRPGRFDEIQVIEGLGETFIQDFLGPLWSLLSEEQRLLIHPWPVAFLGELRSRMTMLPGAVLEDEILDLKTRVEKKELPSWRKKEEIKTGSVKA